MDLLDFEADDLYFDEPMSPDTTDLLQIASERYGSKEAEGALMRAYLTEPGNPNVLVALYRYYYYQHRLANALVIAHRAVETMAYELKIPARWEQLTAADLEAASRRSMTKTRFLLLALKGAGFLKLRLGDPSGALERFAKVLAIDSKDRLGAAVLAAMAKERQGAAE